MMEGEGPFAVCHGFMIPMESTWPMIQGYLQGARERLRQKAHLTLEFWHSP